MWRRQEGSLKRVNSIVMACLICHNLCIDARIGNVIDTVQRGQLRPGNPHAGQLASCPDGVYQTPNGSFVANPHLVEQGECSTEDAWFTAISSCPQHTVLCDYIGALLQVYGAEHLGIDKFGDEVWLSKTSTTFGECTCSTGCSALTSAQHNRVH